ncbi:MAG: RepB family plasmid replication initiator protein [Anaerolineaceae bacterium]
MEQLQLSLIKIENDTVRPNDFIVTKANSLIEANYRLTLSQQRIVLLMASMIQPDDEDFKTYRIYTKDLLDILDINRSHLYAQMVNMIRELMEIVLTIKLSEDKYLNTHWISSQEYTIGVGYSDITFDPKLKPFLLRLKERFTTYKLENVIRLKSVYSIRIYELLKQYQSIGKRTITIELLKNMLRIGPKEYVLYGHFKDRVLNVAYKEINEKTDIAFEFREKKLGRKVNEIEFVIDKKETESKSNELKRQREVRKQEKEDKKKALRQQKIDGYLAKLSPEEQAALTAEAEAMARQEGNVFLKGRKIPEQILNGYRLEIIDKRLRCNKG